MGADTALRQIIYNLILNSLQATKYQGQIKVQTTDVTDSNEMDSKIQLVIKDNGPGISPELLQTLFEPFVTSKNEGTGLGLSIVKQLVLQHFGSITASNDNGAVFTITFPRRRE
jgi:signal transduction histidine kinase